MKLTLTEAAHAPPAKSSTSWLTDRISDALLWPKYLARNSPRRMGRLAGLLNTRLEFRLSGYFAIWLHAFACYAFDLFGGPEIVQFLFRMLAHSRRLTSMEELAAIKVLGSQAIRYGDVRVTSGGFLDPIFRLNRSRAFATWYTINMPTSREADISLMIHELTHVYQYERVGSLYIGQGLWAQIRLRKRAYDYGGVPGLRSGRTAGMRLRDYNREQQSQIVQDYSARLAAHLDTEAYDPFIRELQIGLL